MYGKNHGGKNSTPSQGELTRRKKWQSKGKRGETRPAQDMSGRAGIVEKLTEGPVVRRKRDYKGKQRASKPKPGKVYLKCNEETKRKKDYKKNQQKTGGKEVYCVGRRGITLV